MALFIGGKKQDASLHELILDTNHHTATNVGKNVARRLAVYEDMILKLYAPLEASPRARST